MFPFPHRGMCDLLFISKCRLGINTLGSILLVQKSAHLALPLSARASALSFHLRLDCRILSILSLVPLFFPLLRALLRLLFLAPSLGLQKPRRDTPGSVRPTAHPCAEQFAPAVVTPVQALDLMVRVGVVERQARLWVTVAGWMICDDAYGSRGGFWEALVSCSFIAQSCLGTCWLFCSSYDQRGSASGPSYP